MQPATLSQFPAHVLPGNTQELESAHYYFSSNAYRPIGRAYIFPYMYLILTYVYISGKRPNRQVNSVHTG